MNNVYKILLILGIVISILTGNFRDFDLVILSSIEKGLKIIFTQGVSIILWSGFLNVLIHQPFCERLNKIFLPIIKLIFPNLDFNSNARSHIISNFICNLLGIGAAATPAALLAISELNKEEDYFSIMNLTLLNTTSMAIIPLSLISYRKTLGGMVPFKLVIIYILITVFSIFIVIINNQLQKKKLVQC